MKKLVITLTIAIMLFATLGQRAEQSSTVTKGIPLNAAVEQREELPETNTEQVAKTTGAIYEQMQTESEVAAKERPAVQTPMKECAEETERQKATEPEEAVKCVDKGDQTLAEYKQQIGSQPNPFENAQPTVIIDQSVEDIIGEGEDRPGEGKQF